MSQPDINPSDNTPQDDTDQDKALRISEQNAQARLVLIQLQWLITILLVAAILWLGNNQRKLAIAVDSRLKITEELNARMNDMDDRLFALTPAPKSSADATATAQSDLQLFTIRMEAAQRLYDSGNYEATGEMLKTLMWQLDNKHIAIAAPLKATLIASLQTDIDHLQAIQSQPDAWQTHIIKMRDIQQYLRSLDIPHAGALTRPELELQNASMMLSLAIGAGTLRERDTMTSYLQAALAHLEMLKKLTPVANISATTNETTNEGANATSDKPLTSLDDAIFAVNELLANTPKSRLLTSMRMLNQGQQPTPRHQPEA